MAKKTERSTAKRQPSGTVMQVSSFDWQRRQRVVETFAAKNAGWNKVVGIKVANVQAQHERSRRYTDTRVVTLR